MCHYTLHFFGLTSHYKMQVYQEVHELTYHGGGGFTYSEVYNMPIYLRRFSLKKINDYLKAKQEAEKEAIDRDNSKYK